MIPLYCETFNLYIGPNGISSSKSLIQEFSQFHTYSNPLSPDAFNVSSRIRLQQKIFFILFGKKICMKILFLIFAFKLGHFKVQTIFSYATNTQAYIKKPEKIFILWRKKFGKIDSWMTNEGDREVSRESIELRFLNRGVGS